METAFYRYFNKEQDKDKVIGTASISLIFSSLGFFILAYLLQDQIAHWIDINVKYIRLVIWILLLDALVIIPFAWLRATERPTRYALIKILNVVINLGLNIFFLLLLEDLVKSEESFFASLYIADFEISYIFIANLIASALTLGLMLPFYFRVKYVFKSDLWKSMLRYAFPVLIAGIAFSINETFDRILLKELLPLDTAETDIGMYSACYKIAVFMTLFATAYRLGIEPFFFSHANRENPQKNYAIILEFFVAFGALILLSVVVFADFLKVYIVRSEAYWEAMWIVPIILLANFCLGIYHNLSVWYKITDRTKFGAYISIIGAIVTLTINLLFIKEFSYKASAIATLSAYAIMMILSYYFGRKYYPIPYNLKKIALYLMVSIGLSVFLFYTRFRGNYVVGISAIIVFLGLVLILEKQRLKQLIKP